jgi:hypothetical protein
VLEVINKTERFLDTGTKLYDFYEEFLVVCPKCASMAKVIIDENEAEKLPKGKSHKYINKFFAPRKFVCSKCLHRDTWSGSQIGIGALNVDWYFRLPLWLEVSCCGGETLWAYNLKHLEIIEKYVSAKLRERTKKGRNSFLSKLPQWIKSAKNRDEVLKGIEKIKEKANGKS